MRHHLTLFILGIVMLLSMQLVYALPQELVPEPESEYAFEYAFEYASCGEGTTYQEGICVVDETNKNPNNSSGRWGDFGSAYGERPSLQSPLRQVMLGVPLQSILCNEGLELIFKSIDGSPACVKPETKEILIEKGWAKPPTIENATGLKNTEKDTVAKLLTE